MARAIFSGAVSKGIIDSADINVYTRSESSYSGFECQKYDCANDVFASSDIVFICVKPQHFTDACGGVSPKAVQGKSVVSIMAGVRSGKITAVVGSSAVVRVMPNTPIMLGEGCTALCRTRDVSDAHYALVKGIFAALGSAYEIDESLFDEIIPVNGSSPAFLYLFAKVIAEAAEQRGIDKDTALRMFAQTLIGSGKMILNSDVGIDTLISNVCSKGGTTLAAIDAMEKSGFSQSVKDGFAACVARSKELSDT